MRRTQPLTANTDTSCSSYRPFYQSVTAFNDYKTSNLNTDTIGNYINSSLGTDLAGTTPDASPPQMQQNIQTNLDMLQTLELKAHQLTRCIQNEITQRSEKAGDIYKLQDELTSEEKEANTMEQRAKEAKERANLLKDPYSKTTWHETWFPLGRPVKSESVPVLLSIAIVFLILSLGMFLRLFSIEMRLTSPFLNSMFPRFNSGRV